MKRIFWSALFLFLAGLARADLRPPATGGIQLTSTLQTGATIYISSGSVSTQFNVPNGVTSGNAAAFGQIKIVQVVSANFTASSTTAVTSFVPTQVTASITPTSASNKVLILASSNFELSGAGTTAGGGITLYRGATDLGNADTTSGMKLCYDVLASNDTACDGTIVYMDTPATTSSTVYTVRFKGGTAVTAYYPRNSGTPSAILLVEVAP